MESTGIIQYKWKVGVYDLKDMVKMVKDGVINKYDFFNITRYYFDSVVESNNIQLENS